MGVRGRYWVGAFDIILAALLLMTAGQFAQIAFLRGVTLLGLRTDVPSIVEVSACGKRLSTRIVDLSSTNVLRGPWSAGGPQAPAWVCPNSDSTFSVDLNATATSGQNIALIVNGRVVAERTKTAPLVVFRDVALHGGSNLVSVASGNGAIAELQLTDPQPSYRRTLFGLIPSTEAGKPINIYAGIPNTEMHLLGLIPGRKEELVQGEPNTESKLSDGRYVNFDDAGLGLAHESPDHESNVKSGPLNIARLVKVERLESGKVRVTTKVCLPKDNSLVKWAMQGQLSAIELTFRTSGLRVSAASEEDRIEQTLTRHEYPECYELKGSFVTSAYVMYFFGSFPKYPNDELKLNGFGSGVTFDGPKDVSRVGDTIFRWPEIVNRLELRAGSYAATENPTDSDPDDQSSSKLALAIDRAMSILPYWLKAPLYGLAGLAPIALLLIIIRSPLGERDFETRKRFESALVPLLFLGVAVSLQPLFYQLFLTLSQMLGVWEFIQDARADNGSTWVDPYIPTALAIPFMLVPLITEMQTKRHIDRTQLWRVIVCYLLAFGGLCVTVALLYIEAVAWTPYQLVNKIILFGSQVHSIVEFLRPRGWLIWFNVIVILGLCIALAWISIFRVLRALVFGNNLFGKSLVVASIAILLPLAGYVVEMLRILVAGPSEDASDGTVSLISLAGSTLPMLALLFVLLRSFRDIAAAAAPSRWEPYFTKFATNLVFGTVAITMSLPKLTLSEVPKSAVSGIFEILAVFQSFGIAIATVATIAYLIQKSEKTVPGAGPDIFEFSQSDIALLSALYAGFISLWTTDFAATLVTMLVGWWAFRAWTINEHKKVGPEPVTSEQAQKMFAANYDESLLLARVRSAEDRFRKGEINFDDTLKYRDDLSKFRSEKIKELGLPPGEIKRRLLEYGPQNSPLHNGFVGAVGGAIFATFLQLPSAIRHGAVEGTFNSWLDFTRLALTDPSYNVASGRVGGYRGDLEQSPSQLLQLVATVINLYFLWVVLGFVFGFAFQKIRGGDGFVKGVVFALSVSVSYCVSHLLSVTANDISVAQILSIGLFFLFLGVVVFDSRTLVSRGLRPTKLFEVYGLRASLGYASILAATMVSLEPIVGFLKSFSKQ